MESKIAKLNVHDEEIVDTKNELKVSLTYYQLLLFNIDRLIRIATSIGLNYLILSDKNLSGWSALYSQYKSDVLVYYKKNHFIVTHFNDGNVKLQWGSNKDCNKLTMVCSILSTITVLSLVSLVALIIWLKSH